MTNDSNNGVDGSLSSPIKTIPVTDASSSTNPVITSVVSDLVLSVSNGNIEASGKVLNVSEDNTETSSLDMDTQRNTSGWVSHDGSLKPVDTHHGSSHTCDELSCISSPASHTAVPSNSPSCDKLDLNCVKSEPAVAAHSDVTVLGSFNNMQQCVKIEGSDAESSDSTSDYDSSDADGEPGGGEDSLKMNQTVHTKERKVLDKVGPIVPGEITLYDLPPIEDLKITIDENVELVQLGTVTSIVDCLVVVKANTGTPALDEDTALFGEGRKYMGKVFETFGPVISPFYSIRYNSVEDVESFKVKVTDMVYYAPREEKSLTTYVFVDRLRNAKGSDASWTKNHEPPEQFIDYSDDEQERTAKAKLRSKNRKPEELNEDGANLKKAKPIKASTHAQRNGGQSTVPSRPPRAPHQPPGGRVRPHNVTFSGPPCYPAPPSHTGLHTYPPYHPDNNMWGTPSMPSWNSPSMYHSGWSNYGSPWTQHDSQYYAGAPPAPSLPFVDTRYVQQTDFNSSTPATDNNNQ